MDRQPVGRLLDGDLGVVARAHVDPPVAAVERAAPIADLNLDSIGGVDEVERVEVTPVAEDGVGVARPAGEIDLRGAFDLVATARTELARS